MRSSARNTLSAVYQLNPVVAVENFEEASLALHCVDLELVELNATARDLIAQLDGVSTLCQVTRAMADQYDQPQETIEADAVEIVNQLLKLDIIEPIDTCTNDPNGERATTIKR